MAGIIFLGTKLGSRAKGIRDTFGCALIIGRKGNSDMAVIEDRIVRPVSPFDQV